MHPKSYFRYATALLNVSVCVQNGLDEFSMPFHKSCGYQFMYNNVNPLLPNNKVALKGKRNRYWGFGVYPTHNLLTFPTSLLDNLPVLCWWQNCLFQLAEGRKRLKLHLFPCISCWLPKAKGMLLLILVLFFFCSNSVCSVIHLVLVISKFNYFSFAELYAFSSLTCKRPARN